MKSPEVLAKEIFNNMHQDINTYDNPFDLINMTVCAKKAISEIAEAIRSERQGAQGKEADNDWKDATRRLRYALLEARAVLLMHITPKSITMELIEKTLSEVRHLFYPKEEALEPRREDERD